MTINIRRDSWAVSLGYQWETDAWGLRLYWGKRPDPEPCDCLYLHGLRFECYFWRRIYIVWPRFYGSRF